MKNITSPLVRGEWIEINLVLSDRLDHLSPLVRGEWIEMSQEIEAQQKKIGLPS